MNKKLGLFAKLAFLSILIFLIMSIIQMNIRINTLRQTEQELQAQLDADQLEMEELGQQLEAELDEEMIKKIAREKLGLREPGDIIFASDLPN